MNGWAQHSSSKFCHYFNDGTSLCLRYFDGESVSPLKGGFEEPLPDFCPSCVKKLREIA